MLDVGGILPIRVIIVYASRRPRRGTDFLSMQRDWPKSAGLCLILDAYFVVSDASGRALSKPPRCLASWLG